MRYDIFQIKQDGNGQESEEILGQVVASTPEEAKQAALETFKQARGKKLLVKEAKNKKGIWT